MPDNLPVQLAHEDVDIITGVTARYPSQNCGFGKQRPAISTRVLPWRMMLSASRTHFGGSFGFGSPLKVCLLLFSAGTPMSLLTLGCSDITSHTAKQTASGSGDNILLILSSF